MAFIIRRSDGQPLVNSPLNLRTALPPPSPSPLLIVSCSRDTRILFLVISFLFVSPFCGSTKRIGPFVLPQKGRTVPSLFLFFISPQIFGRSCCGHLLEQFLWTGLLLDLATGVGSGFITNFDYLQRTPGPADYFPVDDDSGEFRPGVLCGYHLRKV